MFRHFKRPGDEHIAYRATSYVTSSQKKGGEWRRLYIHHDSQFNQANMCHFFPFLYSFYVFFYYLLTFIGNTKILHRNFVFRLKSHSIEVAFGVFNSQPLIFHFTFFNYCKQDFRIELLIQIRITNIRCILYTHNTNT